LHFITYCGARKPLKRRASPDHEFRDATEQAWSALPRRPGPSLKRSRDQLKRGRQIDSAPSATGSTPLFRPVSRHQLLSGRLGTGVPRSRRHSIINQGIFIMIKGIFSSIEERVRH
jgi:hypothetical protein